MRRGFSDADGGYNITFVRRHKPCLACT
jgi:hypothetical protein